MKMRRLFTLFLALSTFLVVSAQEKVEVVIQTGHYDQVLAMEFSPDNQRMASAGKDGKIIIWDLTAGKVFRTLFGHEKSISKLIFTPDGKKLVSGGDSQDQDLIVWDWNTGEILLRINDALSNSFSAINMTKDGKYIYGGTYRELKKWNIETGEVVFEITSARKAYNDILIKHTVDDIELSPDEKLMAYSFSGIIHISDANTGELKYTLDAKAEGGDASSLVFSRDGKKLLAGDPMKKVITFDIASQKAISSFETPGHGNTRPCAFDGKGDFFYISDGDQYTKIDVKTGQEVFSLESGLRWAVAGLAVNRDGSLFAVAGGDAEGNTSVRLLDARNGGMIRNLIGYPGAITSLAFNSNGHYLASGSSERYARVWDLGTSKGFVNYSDKCWRQGDIYSSVQWSKDDKKLFMGTQHNTFVWDVNSAVSLGILQQGTKHTHGLMVTSDGKYLVTSQGKPAVFDILSLEKIKELDAPHLLLRSIAESPDGKVLFAGGYKEIKRYKGDVFEELDPLVTDAYAWKMAVSSDGKQIAVVESGEVIIRDAATGAKIKELDAKNNTIEFSPDGKMLVTATGNVITIWSTSDYSKKYTLEGHTDKVNIATFSPDNRFLASGSNDTGIFLWDMKTGKQVATLIALDKEDYIMITPDNYYMTSKNGVKGVAFRKGNKVFPFEQFDLIYNRPDIVLERIGYADQSLIDAYKRSYQKRLDKTGFNLDDLQKDFQVPDLQIKNRDNLSLESGNGQVKLSIKASDTKHPLNRLLVWINDVPVYGTKGLPLAGNTNSIEQELELELLPGINKVQVAVMNQGGVESLKETVEIRFPETGSKPDLYVIGIGVSDYKNSKYNLKYAAKDAKDFALTLKQSSAFENVNEKMLTNEDATKKNILALKEFLAKARTKDVVLVFVAGHGLLDEHFDYYFATHDIDFDHPELLGVEYSQLESILDGIKALRKVLIMDTCHSGEIEKDEVEQDFAMNTEAGEVTFRNVGVGIRKKEGLGVNNTSELMKELFTDLRRGTGATVISSAGGAEFAMESSEWNNGLFTYCLLSSLKQGSSDIDNNGMVHLSELQQYVIEQVKRLSNGKQIPTSRMENLSLDYHIW